MPAMQPPIIGKMERVGTKHLICTVGLPYSGKSSWARNTSWPIVCPDAIRLSIHGQRFLQEAEPMVWMMAKYMVASLFFAGHDHVILDSTCTTPWRRAEWESKHWDTYWKLFKASAEECCRRAELAGDQDIVPIIVMQSQVISFPVSKIWGTSSAI